MPSTGPGAWIAGQGGVGLSGGPIASGFSSSDGPPAQGGAGASAPAGAGDSASSSIVPPAPVVAPSVAAAVRPALPAPSDTSYKSDPVEVHSDIPVLQRESDLARRRFSAASMEVEHLRGDLRAVEVAQGTAEEEARAARDAAADAQARAFGEFLFLIAPSVSCVSCISYFVPVVLEEELEAVRREVEDQREAVEDGALTVFRMVEPHAPMRVD